MAIKFSFPTVAAPTTEVVLGDVEQDPVSRPERKFQSAFDTDAGGQVVYDWGSKTRVFTVRLWPLTSAEVTSLRSFWDSTVNGRATAWEFQDSDSVTYAVRFAQDTFGEVHRFTTHYELTVTLRVN